MDNDQLLRLLRGIVERLESKAEGVGERTEVQLRELLLALELSTKLRPKAATSAAVDWQKHLPLLLLLAVIVAAVVAAALGVDVRSLL